MLCDPERRRWLAGQGQIDNYARRFHESAKRAGWEGGVAGKNGLSAVVSRDEESGRWFGLLCAVVTEALAQAGGSRGSDAAPPARAGLASPDEPGRGGLFGGRALS